MSARTPLLALILGACAQTPGPDDHQAAERQWRLVGLYDGGGLTREATPPDPAWSWRPAPAMTRACGAPRVPFGLGRTEADALMTGQTGALVVLLYHQGGVPGPRLTRDDVRLTLASRCGGAPIELEPAVMPRALRVAIEAPPDHPALLEEHQDELAQSLSVTACMEHRLQRAWVGGDEAAVQEALLMASVDDDADRAFVGQGAPVPALWGAPDVCLITPTTPGPGRAASASSPTLHPADVWGGALRLCEEREVWESSPAHGGLVAPLSLLGAVTTQRPEPVRWQTLTLSLVPDNNDLSDDDTVLVSLDGARHAAPVPIRQGQPGARSSHLTDLLAMIPPEYPTYEVTSAVDEWLNDRGTAEVAHHYAALVVPAWQLQEPCLTEDEAGALDAVGAPVPDRPTQADPIGELLSAPERLQVLARSDAGWADLNPHRDAWLPRFGTPVNIEAARRPLVALSARPPTPEESQRANRAAEESLTLLGGAALLICLALGLRRVPELWAPQPELRGERWTERPPEDRP